LVSTSGASPRPIHRPAAVETVRQALRAIVAEVRKEIGQPLAYPVRDDEARERIAPVSAAFVAADEDALEPVNSKINERPRVAGCHAITLGSSLRTFRSANCIAPAKSRARTIPVSRLCTL
jgi:hypothetical protein